MRTGCIVTAVVVVIVLAIAGYYGYQVVSQGLDIPDDLSAFSEQEGMLEQINSKAPSPSDTAHLTPERVGLFIGALDSVEAGWRGLALTLDSLGIGKSGGKDFDLWTSPAIIREVIKVPLVTRRALVAYLNEKNLSWAEYIWLKERVVAASGIEYREFDSSIQVLLHQRMKIDEDVATLSEGDKQEGASLLFQRAGELRASGAIDSADIALVAPYREDLLSRGIPALAGLETDDEALKGSISFKQSDQGQ